MPKLTAVTVCKLYNGCTAYKNKNAEYWYSDYVSNIIIYSVLLSHG